MSSIRVSEIADPPARGVPQHSCLVCWSCWWLTLCIPSARMFLAYLFAISLWGVAFIFIFSFISLGEWYGVLKGGRAGLKAGWLQLYVTWRQFKCLSFLKVWLVKPILPWGEALLCCPWAWWECGGCHVPVSGAGPLTFAGLGLGESFPGWILYLDALRLSPFFGIITYILT